MSASNNAVARDVFASYATWSQSSILYVRFDMYFENSKFNYCSGMFNSVLETRDGDVVKKTFYINF